ncbi:hypothetical protein MRB53_042340 [Persea americana]|nr:hypothetical protein MRB53_042340 [Persea americana]
MVKHTSLQSQSTEYTYIIRIPDLFDPNPKPRLLTGKKGDWQPEADLRFKRDPLWIQKISDHRNFVAALEKDDKISMQGSGHAIAFARLLSKNGPRCGRTKGWSEDNISLFLLLRVWEALEELEGYSRQDHERATYFPGRRRLRHARQATGDDPPPDADHASSAHPQTDARPVSSAHIPPNAHPPSTAHPDTGTSAGMQQFLRLPCSLSDISSAAPAQTNRVQPIPIPVDIQSISLDQSSHHTPNAQAHGQSIEAGQDDLGDNPDDAWKVQQSSMNVVKHLSSQISCKLKKQQHQHLQCQHLEDRQNDNELQDLLQLRMCSLEVSYSHCRHFIAFPITSIVIQHIENDSEQRAIAQCGRSVSETAIIVKIWIIHSILEAGRFIWQREIELQFVDNSIDLLHTQSKVFLTLLIAQNTEQPLTGGSNELISYVSSGAKHNVKILESNSGYQSMSITGSMSSYHVSLRYMEMSYQRQC